MEKDRDLLACLEKYSRSDFYPFHMPGHKRNLKDLLPGILSEAAAVDITEIDGFDNLHEPEGILSDAMERAARLYGADHAFYSVNGSTAGLLTAISAAVPDGGTLIMARNCHKAVYHGVYLRRLKPVYLYPETVKGLGIAGGISPAQVEAALRAHPDAKAVLLTSPTYDGIVSDVEEIAQIAHAFHVPLIVDAAHGAHFGFHPGFPDSPVHQGADLTVVSLHKTMPCMTQTALLLVRKGRVSLERLRLFEGIYQTSSPSYLLMAGMDSCIGIVEEKRQTLWNDFFRDREDFLKKCGSLKALQVVAQGSPAGGSREFLGEAALKRMDPGKILIDCSHTDLTGKQLYDILLERYHLQMEMAAGDYVTAIMTCCDRKEGWERLEKALHEIEEQYGLRRIDRVEKAFLYPRAETGCSLSEALDAPAEEVELSEAAGRISGDFVNLYPPGIPIMVPGERVSEEAIELLTRCRRQNLPLCGLKEGALTVIKGKISGEDNSRA